MNIIQSLSVVGEQLDTGLYTEQTRKFHTLELGSEPTLTQGKKRTLILPKEKNRTNQVCPNSLYDKVKDLSGSNPKKKAAFWDLAETICRGAGDEKALKAVQATAPADIEYPKDGWVILTLEGEFLTNRPLIQKYLKAEEAASEGSSDFCVVSGKPCDPLRLHPPISGVRGTGDARMDYKKPTPLLSWHKPAYEYRRQSQGNNFPVSKTVGRRYSLALNYLLEPCDDRAHRSAVDLTIANTMVFWPEEGAIVHPLLGIVATLLSKYLTTAAAEELWAELEASTPDDIPVRVVLLKGSKGRIAVLNDGKTTLPKLRESMLRFKSSVFWRRQPTLTNIRTLKSRGHDIFPNEYIIGIAWAVFTGGSFPKTFQHWLLQHMATQQPPRPGSTESDQFQASLDWLDTIRRYHNPKETFMSKPNPDLEKIDAKEFYAEFLEVPEAHFDPEYLDNPLYTFGRLVSLVCGLRQQAHKRMVRDTMSAEVSRAQKNPRAYYPELLEQGTLYSGMLDKDHRHPLLRNQWVELSGNMAAMPRRLTPLQNMAMAMGISHQRLYNERFFTWRTAANKPKEKPKEKTQEDAA